MILRLTGTTSTYSAAQPPLPPPILDLAHEVQVLVNLEVANVRKKLRNTQFEIPSTPTHRHAQADRRIGLCIWKKKRTLVFQEQSNFRKNLFFFLRRTSSPCLNGLLGTGAEGRTCKKYYGSVEFWIRHWNVLVNSPGTTNTDLKSNSFF